MNYGFLEPSQSEKADAYRALAREKILGSSESANVPQRIGSGKKNTREKHNQRQERTSISPVLYKQQ
jgi:hypothetical protein